MDVLANQTNFQSLSFKDLLEARDQYHWHLMNKANVIGTAVGLYLIRKHDRWPSDHASVKTLNSTRSGKAPRTFDNSEVRPYSWPCILVLVDTWTDASHFGGEGPDPSSMVPRTLFLPDGRAAPVCVVFVKEGVPQSGAPVDTRWPRSYLGGGCPLIVDVQGAERIASVGCLVSDGHKTYALTNRHVCGDTGSIVRAKVRGNIVPVGRSAPKQLTKDALSDVYPAFPARRTFLTLDVGLVDVDTVDDWTSQPFGLGNTVGDVADLNELNLGLQLIDQPVCAFGAVSGKLEGSVKALFYRHKSQAGYDYVSEFLIAPAHGAPQTSPGDSGTIWHLVTRKDPDHPRSPIVLRPLAVEWGGQTLLGPGKKRLNFALATGLSTVCQLLEVDLVTDHNTGPHDYWGQTGHYGIASAAISVVQNPELKALLNANIERISFLPDQLTPDQIRQRLSKGDFVELADVPDLVWKKVPAKVPGGRDYAQNAGPEHPNHYADIDAPDAGGGPTLRDLSLQSTANMDVEVWRRSYQANGQTQARQEGLLPFRVWQFFDEMTEALRQSDIARFVCAAGIVSHYVGDACQPLHGSYLADGFKDPSNPQAKKWPGKGVHATYEDKMVDRFSKQLLPSIGPEAINYAGAIPPIASGRDAAFATVTLMSQVATILPPATLCNEYIRLGGGGSVRVVEGLWSAFGADTATVMGAGARFLAAIWDAAFAVAGTPLPPNTGTVPEATLAEIYQDTTFVPSLTLDKIGAVLR